MQIAKKYKKIHFIGIGGAGMSGIAEVLHNLGFKITGSDIQENEVTKHLEEIGIKIYYGHHPDHVDDADLVVISTAVKEDNIEVQKAREKQIPVIRRALMLAELTRIKYSIAVSGAHGKTTTTSMIADVLAKGGLDPTVIVGGVIKGLKSGAKLGHS
ncbi:MAG: Mur ligase domain-containing protein, partial [candidate division WOR-3 bacterium]